MSDLYCAVASSDADEGLFGSAVAETEVWIVLEYTGTWEPKPLPPSELPEPVKARIGEWLERVPKSRHQFIRRSGRTDRPPLLYVACSRERAPWMVEIQLQRYEDLLDLDLEALLSRQAAPGAREVKRPLHLVCTHGKRDRCCARWGAPLYRALAERDPEGVWHTTHLGGHRFAANVLLLPHGISYGQVRPEEAERLLAAHAERELFDLDRLRGRTCYDRPAQAAEYFLRLETGERALEGLTRLSSDKEDGDVWRIAFEAPGGSSHELRVAREPTGALRPSSCGGEPEPASRFRRL